MLSYQETRDNIYLEKLCELNKGIIYKMATRYKLEGIQYVDIEDLVQEGYIALIRAAKRYNKEKGVLFISYLVAVINGHIFRYLKQRIKNNEVSYNTEIYSKDSEKIELLDSMGEIDINIEGVEHKLSITKLHSDLEKALSELPSIHSEVIKMYYGLDYDKNLTLTAIGELLSVSSQVARRYKDRGLKQLKEADSLAYYRDMMVNMVEKKEALQEKFTFCSIEALLDMDIEVIRNQLKGVKCG